MDEFEDFLNVFFQECDERLGELQDCLASMVEGDWDMETLNAAFRAVHSVKGGAGAFGLDDLVSFTHVFETTMDALRSGQLECNEKVCNVLLRASDMMSALIESAQGNGEHNREVADKLRQELAELAGVEAPKTEAKPAEEAAPAAEAAAAESAAADAEAEDEPEEREVTIRIAPGPDFIRSGHDPLKVIRALKKFGSIKVEAQGQHPLLEELDVIETSFAWTVTLDTAVDADELDGFLMIYTMTADVEVQDPWAGQDRSAQGQADKDQADQGENEPAEAEPAKAEADAAPTEAASAETKEGDSAPSAAQPAEKPEADAKPAAPADDAPTANGGAATPPAGGGGGGGAAATAAQQQKVAKALRVELSRIDRLVNMVGEIVITQAVLKQNFAEIENHQDIEIGHAVEALSRQTRELQESVMAIRAQPVKSVFSRMPRVVRDLCASLGKEAKIVLSGEHTEVDTTVIEELSEPLTHMLRNSMDHGIEMPDAREAAGKTRVGTINLSAEHRGERVRIVIEDDGAGINRDKVLQKAIKNGVVQPDASLSDEEVDMLVFHPGFSTAEKVTNVSGRGVGMDVVKKKVQALGGRVSVHNEPGKGARFAITLPLTLAVLDGMTIGVGSERFILPLSSVVEAVKVDKSNIDYLTNDVRVLRYRGEWLPLISLRDALGLDLDQQPEDLVVVVETETEGRVAILVDELLGQLQVVLKSLEANFKRIDGVSGATILGDGRVALILDIPALQSLAGGSRAPYPQEIGL